MPGIEELDVIETWAGLRPASRDHAPMLGRTSAPGVVAATGHYRHGILLAPVTADEVAADVRALLAGTPETRPILRPFSPLRFSDAPAMPTIVLNGHPRDVPDGLTVETLLAHVGRDPDCRASPSPSATASCAGPSGPRRRSRTATASRSSRPPRVAEGPRLTDLP